MSTLCDSIYKLAEPYWATRKNELHVPSSYGFARRLLGFYPSADEDIVLPAVLLHDVGWKMIPAKLHRAFSIFIFNSKGEMLIHKRSSIKKTWPGYCLDSR